MKTFSNTLPKNPPRDLAGASMLPERKSIRSPRQMHRTRPILRFSPTAWAKLLYLRDRGPTEVGGFGLSAADDFLFVEDVRLIRQQATDLSVQFDDTAVAEFFDEQVDQDRRPEQFARIWLHTHPGESAQPSGTDEGTFSRCFGRTDWSLMFILACGGQTYARLEFHAGPGGALLLPVTVDYRREFPAADHAAWEQEYLANVQCVELRLPLPPAHAGIRSLPAEELTSAENGDFGFEYFEVTSFLEESGRSFHADNL